MKDKVKDTVTVDDAVASVMESMNSLNKSYDELARKIVAYEEQFKGFRDVFIEKTNRSYANIYDWLSAYGRGQVLLGFLRGCKGGVSAIQKVSRMSEKDQQRILVEGIDILMEDGGTKKKTWFDMSSSEFLRAVDSSGNIVPPSDQPVPVRKSELPANWKFDSKTGLLKVTGGTLTKRDVCKMLKEFK